MKAPEYTDAEKALILDVFQRTGSALRAAKASGKSSSGVSNFLIRGGHYTPVKAIRPWTVHEEATLVELWTRKVHTSEIAARLRRTESSVLQYATKHRKRLGIKPRNAGKWQTVEHRLIAREVEIAIERIAAGLPHRPRATINHHMVRYLYAYADREKKRARNASIQDVGGMNQAAVTHQKRKTAA